MHLPIPHRLHLTLPLLILPLLLPLVYLPALFTLLTTQHTILLTPTHYTHTQSAKWYTVHLHSAYISLPTHEITFTAYRIYTQKKQNKEPQDWSKPLNIQAKFIIYLGNLPILYIPLSRSLHIPSLLDTTAQTNFTELIGDPLIALQSTHAINGIKALLSFPVQLPTIPLPGLITLQIIPPQTKFELQYNGHPVTWIQFLGNQTIIITPRSPPQQMQVDVTYAPSVGDATQQGAELLARYLHPVPPSKGCPPAELGELLVAPGNEPTEYAWINEIIQSHPVKDYRIRDFPSSTEMFVTGVMLDFRHYRIWKPLTIPGALKFNNTLPVAVTIANIDGSVWYDGTKFGHMQVPEKRLLPEGEGVIDDLPVRPTNLLAAPAKLQKLITSKKMFDVDGCADADVWIGKFFVGRVALAAVVNSTMISPLLSSNIGYSVISAA